MSASRASSRLPYTEFDPTCSIPYGSRDADEVTIPYSADTPLDTIRAPMMDEAKGDVPAISTPSTSTLSAAPNSIAANGWGRLPHHTNMYANSASSSPPQRTPSSAAAHSGAAQLSSPTAVSSAAFAQTPKIRNLTNRFFAVKGDMELMIARLHNLLDELRILELTRSDARRAVCNWNAEFAQLTGYIATDSDKRRSTIFTRLAARLVSAQREFAQFHPKVAEFAEVTRDFYEKHIRPYIVEYETIAVHLITSDASTDATAAPTSPAKDFGFQGSESKTRHQQSSQMQKQAEKLISGEARCRAAK